MNVGFRIPGKVDAEQLEPTLDLRQYLNFVWRNWIFIASITIFVFLIGVIHLARATPLYTATTQVLIGQQEKPPSLSPIVNDGGTDSDFYIANQLAILRSDSLLRRVAIKEWPPVPPANANETQSTDVGKEGSTSAQEEAIRNGINRVRGALAVSRAGLGRVLDISITWVDPNRAAQLASAVADAYVVDQLDARLESAKRASGWLSDRLVELRRQLSDSEEALAKFREEHGLTRSGPTVALNDQQLADLNGKLVAARADVAEKKARVNFLNELAEGKKTIGSLPDSLVSTSSVIGALRTKLMETSQREADLLARYDSRYPAVVNVQAEKRDIQRSIVAETQRMAQNFKSEYALARMRRDAMEKFMSEASGQGELDYNDAVKLRELERTAAVNKTLFEEFLQKAKVTDEQATFRVNDIRVIMPAQTGVQTYPNTRKILMMALLAGLGLGVGGAFAMEKLKTGFTTPREVEAALGLPVLASVRKVNKSQLIIKDGKNIPLPFYQIHHPLSPFSETMRTLRSGVHMSDVDQPPKVINVTSAVPGEGKTTIATSLAISAASAGLKVVLVDADLRHPVTSRFFKLERENGLVDVLLGTTTIDNVAKFYKDLNLTVIPAGSKSLNPPDVLGSERMKALMSRLKETCDYVVLDTPPVGPVVDSVVVANLADKTVFVVAWASTPRETVEMSIKQVSVRKGIAGVVFNRVNQGRARKYGGGYSHAKSYEKYYSEVAN
jgi:capsular exopolysaccharide synthesis family protein